MLGEQSPCQHPRPGRADGVRDNRQCLFLSPVAALMNERISNSPNYLSTLSPLPFPHNFGEVTFL